MVRYARRAALVAGARPAVGDVVALAAVDAGLKPGALTKDEMVRFRGKRTEYLEAR